MPVDPQVYDLALHLMRDVKCTSKEEVTQELAEAIQDLAEQFIAGAIAVESE